MAKVIHSLGSFCRGLFSDALQFLKRWFIQSPDLLFMSVSSRGISACNSTSTLGGPLPPRSSCDLAAHMAPLRVRALWPFLQVSVHSSLQYFTQTFVCWVSAVLPVHGEFTPFLLLIVISGVPGGSRAKHVFGLEMWLWWWHWWPSPCDWLAR